MIIAKPSLSNIIYDKNNIVLTEIELNKYQNLYFQSRKIELNKVSAIKKLVLQKKTINHLIKFQKEFIKKLDDQIISEYGQEVYEDEIKRDFIRFLKIRNEFVLEYFNRDLTHEDIENVMNSFKEFYIPISKNNCMTVDDNINVIGNKKFIINLFDNLKKRSDDYSIVINGEYFDLCMSQKSIGKIEQKLINFIEIETEDQFNQFIYGK